MWNIRLNRIIKCLDDVNVYPYITWCWLGQYQNMYFSLLNCLTNYARGLPPCENCFPSGLDRIGCLKEYFWKCIYLRSFLCNFPFKRQGRSFILFLIDLVSFADKKLILYINFCSKTFEESVENKKPCILIIRSWIIWRTVPIYKTIVANHD